MSGFGWLAFAKADGEGKVKLANKLSQEISSGTPEHGLWLRRHEQYGPIPVLQTRFARTACHPQWYRSRELRLEFGASAHTTLLSFLLKMGQESLSHPSVAFSKMVTEPMIEEAVGVWIRANGIVETLLSGRWTGHSLCPVLLPEKR